jgi:hypothetical protein
VLLDETHDGRPDDDAVGEATNLGRLLGRADPEAHAHRLGGDGAQGAELLGQLGGQPRALPGDPGERDHVDEAEAGAGDAAHPLRRGRRGHQMDQVEAGRDGLGAQRLRFLGRQVGDDDAVDARLHRGPAEGLEPEGEDRVVVGEEDEGRRHLAPHLPHKLQHAR